MNIGKSQIFAIILFSRIALKVVFATHIRPKGEVVRFVLVMLSCLFVAALWSLAGKALLYVMFYCVFATCQCGVLSQVWYLIVSNPDLCLLTYLFARVLFLRNFAKFRENQALSKIFELTVYRSYGIENIT